MMTDSPALWTLPSVWGVLGGAFLVAVALGALLAETRYCSLGAVSDWVLLGDTRRFRMWGIAVGVALAGSGGLELLDGLDPSATLVPYASPHFAWLRYVLGGLLFGFGMQLASGCASRLLLRIGGGSLKALTATAVAAVCAAWLIDGGAYRRVLAPPLELGAVDFAAPPRLGTWLATAVAPALAPGQVALLLGIALVVCAGRARLRRREWAGGVGLGLAVVAGWWLSGGAPGRTWQEDMAFLHAIPRGVGTQSYAFVAPLADALALLRGRAPTFALCGGLGLVLGSLLWHWRRGRLRIERHRDARDLARSLLGGALLGVGGVLAMGCTIGQGVTGLSTLAPGSLLATAATLTGVTLAVHLEYRYGAAA
ncbi:MAG TPA: YeeE/YedE thiosulfate transporter family protein [Gammaproteobacteria bacterium]|nr:YeeE/YedE thiosulfate transporter family protein [Gammaproteobacteria bacterium]